MSKINKINELVLIFDSYNALLTEKQIKVFKLYYLNDLSLSEIAKMMNTSRSSVSDNLKKTEEKLIKYEEKLQLSKRNIKIEKLLYKLDNEEIIKKIKDLL